RNRCQALSVSGLRPVSMGCRIGLAANVYDNTAQKHFVADSETCLRMRRTATVVRVWAIVTEIKRKWRRGQQNTQKKRLLAGGRRAYYRRRSPNRSVRKADMYTLILSISCSVAVSVLLKVARSRAIAVDQAIALNYVMAGSLCWILLGSEPGAL